MKEIIVGDIPKYFKEHDDITKSLITAIQSDNPEQIKLTLLGPLAPLFSWIHKQKIPTINLSSFFILTLPCTYGEKVPEKYQNDYERLGFSFQSQNCEINVNLTDWCKPTLENIFVAHKIYTCKDLPEGLTLSKDGILSGSTQNITKPTTIKITLDVVAADNSPLKIVYNVTRDFYVLLIPYPNLKISLQQKQQSYINNVYQPQFLLTYNGQGIAIADFLKTAASIPGFSYTLIKDNRAIEVETTFNYFALTADDKDNLSDLSITFSNYKNKTNAVLYLQSQDYYHIKDFFDRCLYFNNDQTLNWPSPDSVQVENFTFENKQRKFSQCKDIIVAQKFKNNKIQLKNLIELKGKERRMQYTEVVVGMQDYQKYIITQRFTIH